MSITLRAPTRPGPTFRRSTRHRQGDLRRDEGSAADLHARARGRGGVRRRRPVRRPGPAADRSRSLRVPDAGLAGHRHRRPRRAADGRRTGRDGLPQDLADASARTGSSSAAPRRATGWSTNSSRCSASTWCRAPRRPTRSTTRSPPGWPSPSSGRAPCSTASTSRSSRRRTPRRRTCASTPGWPPTGWASGCCRRSGPTPWSTWIGRPGAPTSPSWRASPASTPRRTTASSTRCVAPRQAFVEAGALATDHGHLLADTTPMEADAARALYSRVLDGEEAERRRGRRLRREHAVPDGRDVVSRTAW